MHGLLRFEHPLLSKLDVVDCKFDPDDRMQPRQFTSDDNRLTLTICPLYQQHSKQDVGLINAELFKIHGRYSGTLVLNDGTRLEVNDRLALLDTCSSAADGGHGRARISETPRPGFGRGTWCKVQPICL